MPGAGGTQGFESGFWGFYVNQLFPGFVRPGGVAVEERLDFGGVGEHDYAVYLYAEPPVGFPVTGVPFFAAFFATFSF